MRLSWIIIMDIENTKQKKTENYLSTDGTQTRTNKRSTQQIAAYKYSASLSSLSATLAGLYGFFFPEHTPQHKHVSSIPITNATATTATTKLNSSVFSSRDTDTLSSSCRESISVFSSPITTWCSS